MKANDEGTEQTSFNDQAGDQKTLPAATDATAGENKKAGPKQNRTSAAGKPAAVKEVSKPDGATMKVTALVNMITPDGTHLEVGKEVTLTQSEAKRLSQDKRGPFFK